MIRDRNENFMRKNGTSDRWRQGQTYSKGPACHFEKTCRNPLETTPSKVPVFQVRDVVARGCGNHTVLAQGGCRRKGGLVERVAIITGRAVLCYLPPPRGNENNPKTLVDKHIFWSYSPKYLGEGSLMRRKRKPLGLTPLELEIMKVLWEKSPATVQSVRDALPGEPKLAYTTVQTMLNVLLRKGKVKRALRGRAFEYEAAVTREKAVSQTLHDMIQRLFGGSAESMVMSLVQARHLTPEKLAKLNKLLERSRRKEEVGHGSN